MADLSPAVRPQWRARIPPKEQEDVLQYCKLRYLEGANWTALFEETGLPANVFYKECKGWKAERDKLYSKKVAEVLQATIGEKSESIVQDVLDLISKGLQQYKQEGAVIDEKAISNLSMVAIRLHNILRLESNKATSIATVQNYPPEKVIELVEEKTASIKDKYGDLFIEEEWEDRQPE